MPRKHKLRVLFVCIGNACRSPMAEAIARHHASEVMEPSSAGLNPLGRVAELTKQTLLDNGYSIEELSSKPLRREALDNADVIINLSGATLGHRFDDGEPGMPDLRISQKVEDWNVEDPYGADAATYQRILGEIECRVLQLAARLREPRKHSSTRPKRRSFAKG